MKNQIKTYAIITIAFVSGFLISCSKDVKVDESKLPVVANAAVTDVASHRPIVSADVTSIGGSGITEQGICYDTMPNPTIEKTKRKSDSAKLGPFSIKLGGLKPNTTYYARAYATNSTGTAYSNELNFYIDAVKIGDFFGGGLVFYLEASGKHGLISAPAGNNHSGVWGCAGVSVPGTKTEIGTGKKNTELIIAACTSGAAENAAKWCDELVDNGYKDWFLPSRDELAEMYKYRELIGFNEAVRWSSSEADANNVWAQGFSAASANATPASKSTSYGIRAIRAF